MGNKSKQRFSIEESQVRKVSKELFLTKFEVRNRYGHVRMASSYCQGISEEREGRTGKNDESKW